MYTSNACSYMMALLVKFYCVNIITVGSLLSGKVSKHFITYISQCYYVLENKNNTLFFTLYFCRGIISLIMSMWNCSTASCNLFMHDLMKYNGHPFKKSGMSLFIKVPIFSTIRLDVTYLKKMTVLSNIPPQYVNLCLY